MTSDSNTICITMETIEQEVASEYLDNVILNAINTIRNTRKRPDISSIHECLQKNLNNFDVTTEILESRLSFLIKKIELKLN